MRLAGILLAALLVGACGASEPPSPSPPVAASPTPSATATDGVPTGTPPATPAGVSGEVPAELLAPVLAEAAALADVDVSAVSVIRAEQVIWNDGSLGCPEPDTVYPQVLVDGYWVVVEAGGEEYDFRLTENGHFRLCPPGRRLPPLG